MIDRWTDIKLVNVVGAGGLLVVGGRLLLHTGQTPSLFPGPLTSAWSHTYIHMCHTESYTYMNIHNYQRFIIIIIIIIIIYNYYIQNL